MKITSKLRLQSHFNRFITPLLIVCLTILLAWLSVRYQTQMDWTQSGRHTLSQASQEVLDQMDGSVEITAYARSDAALRQTIKKIVGRYQRFKTDINLHFINPDVVPDEIRNIGISVNGELLLHYQGRTEHVKTGAEEEFTNALQRLVRGSKYWLAFLEGHGERNPLGTANHDLKLWASQLVLRGFKIQPLNLATAEAVPNNTKILIIASPTVDIFAEEITLIVEYISRGGNILWLADPSSLHGLESLADQLNVKIRAGMMVDSSGSLLNIEDPTILINTPDMYPEHAITKAFNLTTFFPTTTSIQIEEQAEHLEKWNKSSLLISSEHSWLETGSLQGEVEFNEDSDTSGSLDIGITLERTIHNESNTTSSSTQQRIIIIGDGDFLSNAYVGNSGNLDFGVRLINWLSNDDSFISIPAKTISDAHLEFPDYASWIIGFGFILVLPLIFLGAGLFIWWRRKKQ